mgnify:FL=1
MQLLTGIYGTCLAQCSCTGFWRYRCLLYSFVRLEKGEIRNKDKRELLPAGNTVSRLIPQIVAAEPDEFRMLVEQISGWGYREIDLNMAVRFR